MISKIKSKLQNKKQSSQEVNLSTSQSTPEIEYKFLEQFPMAAAVFDLKGNYKYVNDEYIMEDRFKNDIIGKDDSFYFELLGVNLKSADKRKKIFKQVIKDKKTDKLITIPHSLSVIWFGDLIKEIIGE